MKPQTGFFNQYPEFYDLMIPWEQRLARELPFFNNIFKKYSVQSILDCGCSSGWHAISFTKQGYQVVGIDNSRPVINLAGKNAMNQKVQVKFFVGDFRTLSKTMKNKFDSLICIGNSLALLEKRQDILKSLKEMYKRLNKNGILILQVLNFEKNRNKPIFELPPRLFKKNGIEYTFLRFFDLSQSSIKSYFTLLQNKNGNITQEIYTNNLYFFTIKKMKKLMQESGFNKIDYYGDINFSKFSPNKSHDIIVLAQKI